MTPIKVIWNIPKPNSLTLCRNLIASHYEVARRSGENVQSLLIRHTDIHATTTRRGQRVKDALHLTPSYQTEIQASLGTFGTAHAYTPNYPQFRVGSVVYGSEKPLSTIKNGKLIWPSDTNAQAVEEYDKSVLEDWADELQGIKQAENDGATPSNTEGGDQTSQ